MGTSTNGQIFYGVVFEEGQEFPWDAEYGGEMDEWWLREVHGFKHSVELYGSDGKYLNGRKPSDDEFSRYFGERQDFAAARPLRVRLVNYCSAECPMYALAVPGTVITATRGDPTSFAPSELVVPSGGAEALLAFCAQHGIEVEGSPGWHLSSYWG